MKCRLTVFRFQTLHDRVLSVLRHFTIVNYVHVRLASYIKTAAMKH